MGMRVHKPAPLTRRPGVSVVVPCYNYGHYLPHLVTTLRAQADVDVEIIIVDDASPDGSGNVAEELAATGDDIVLVRHETNKGHIRTYNDGFMMASREYVTLVSADDLLPLGALARATALMEAHPSVGFVYGYARSFSGEAPATVGRVRSWTVWSGRSWIALSARLGRSFIASPEVVMRTEALRAVGDYDPRLPHSADLDMWLRTALHYDVGRVNGPDQAHYRVHDANMHLTTFDGYVIDLKERRTTFDLLFEEHARDRDDILRLRDRTRRALANEAIRRALADVRDGRTDAADAFITFARETDPTIERSPWWWMWSAGPGRGRRYPFAGLRSLGARAAHHAAWRRERRYGF